MCRTHPAPVGLSSRVGIKFGDHLTGTLQPLGLCITLVVFGDCSAAGGKVFPSLGDQGEDDCGREEGQGKHWEQHPELSQGVPSSTSGKQ